MEVNTNNQTSQTPQHIARQIDAIIAELLSLRQTVVTMQPESENPSHDIVDELAGALGQGSWEEYDELLDWKRFDE